MYAFFVDLRAALDTVDRGKLREALKKKGLSDKLRDRLRD